jgi:membrane-associated phospholipid phosphatase
MDNRFYLDVNRLAVRSAWAHGVMSFLARPYALAIVAFLVLVALVRARGGGFGGSDLDQLAAVTWVVVGAAVAFAISVPVLHLVARERPFTADPTAILVVPRPGGFSFPDQEAVVAAAAAAGLWLCRAFYLASLATVLALAMAFAAVYVGVNYPGDALGGLLIGALLTLALYPVAIGTLRAGIHAAARSPLRVLVGGAHGHRSVGPGPAARPEPVGESGAVRILSPEERSVRGQQ